MWSYSFVGTLVFTDTVPPPAFTVCGSESPLLTKSVMILSPHPIVCSLGRCLPGPQS